MEKDIIKRKKGLSTKAKILENAVDLMADQGSKHVTIRELSRTVGIRESSFYNHFESKEALIETLYEQFKSRLVAHEPSLEVLHQMAVENNVETCLLTYVLQYSQPEDPLMQKLYKLILLERFTEAKAAQIYLDLCMDRAEEQIVQLFDSLKAIGKIRSLASKPLAKAFNHMVIGFAEGYGMSEQGYVSKEQALEDMIQGIRIFSQAVSQ